MIIPVTKENEEVWALMCVALWPEDTFDDWIREGRDKDYENEFLFIDNGEAVAFCNISLRNEYVEGTGSSPVGYLEAIYVEPEFRNQGIARKLVEYAKKWAVDKGCIEFASDCELSNDVSRKFHNKIGFTEANINVHFTMNLQNNT